ncbi:MAG TPA: hypothetical protein VK919_13000 [Solirubrobacterales bacterium]|nr:hypothetical protein [Solirubrobacterales bacterium]
MPRLCTRRIVAEPEVPRPPGQARPADLVRHRRTEQRVPLARIEDEVEALARGLVAAARSG